MKWGSGVAQPSWLSMLPGCVVAGIGLGLTNTTVTNTTTGAVPTERAGMASGIDMSARMISLAINIALMGLILVAGTSAGLSRMMSGDAEARHSVAVAMAGGQSVSLAPDVVHGALAQGFQWVMLYGGLSVWLLAGASLWVFGVKGGAREINGAARALP
jgi:hypothetical protein